MLPLCRPIYNCSLVFVFHLWGLVAAYLVECDSARVCLMLSHDFTEVMDFFFCKIFREVMCTSKCIVISVGTWCQCVLFLVVLILMTWLRWHLPGPLPANSKVTIFSSTIKTFMTGRDLKLCASPILILPSPTKFSIHHWPSPAIVVAVVFA